ncbi:MAG: CPXCG motif-containing cysteine-rich protein [Bradymonadaceae bacterium]|nr:CPXCG motif-containing cysteine-rich protein [Lujinxingiaceae bacterium]
MQDTFEIQCPYCFEFVEIYLEADVAGELVQDCEVCCRPWLLRVRRSAGGDTDISVSRAG